MKTYWCVQQKYFDSGAVKVLVFKIEANEKPENSTVENKMCDEYRDYFESYDEAAKFAEEARSA